MKPGLNYHPLANLPLQISSINAINGGEAGVHQMLSQPPRAAFPGLCHAKRSFPCVRIALHTMYTCIRQNEAGPLPTQEALPQTQLNEDMYVHICTFSEHVWGTKDVPGTASRH